MGDYMTDSCKTREVEYFRLWGTDHGTWDTDYIRIPADTDDYELDAAICAAVEKIDWGYEMPVIVGFYSEHDNYDENGEPI
jgi:hypothetical protein